MVHSLSLYILLCVHIYFSWNCSVTICIKRIPSDLLFMAPHSSTLAWKIPWTEEPGRWQSTGRKESDMTEWLPFHFSLSCIGEGNGSPLQYSCMENPRDRGAWWAAVYEVTQSWTWLKWPVNFLMFKLVLKKAEEPEIKFPTSVGSLKKQESSRKNIYFWFIDYAKAFDCVDHSKLWKILKEMGISDHLTCFLRSRFWIHCHQSSDCDQAQQSDLAITMF